MSGKTQLPQPAQDRNREEGEGKGKEESIGSLREWKELNL